MNWINYNSNCSWIKCLKTLYVCDIEMNSAASKAASVQSNLLCVDIDARQPASKSRMTMIPTYYHFWSIEQDVNTKKIKSKVLGECALISKNVVWTLISKNKFSTIKKL